MSTGEVRSRLFFRQIIADGNGLRWQEKYRGEWQTAAWEDVSDFYLEALPPPQFVGLSPFVVRFRDGRTLTFSASWGNHRALAGMVAYHAKPETARRPDGTIGWEQRGTRPSELPASFTYSEEYVFAIRSKIIRNALIRLAILIGAGIILGLLHASSSVGGLITPMLIPFLGELAHWPGVKQIAEVRRRSKLGERFDVTNESLTFWQNGEPYTVRWSEIVGYDEPVFSIRPQEDTIRIRTVTGKEFSFTSKMQGTASLAKIIALHARDAVAYRRGKNDQDALGGVEIRWTGGDEGKGDRVFHQRTRTNRKQLLLLWAIPLLQLVALLFLMGYPLPFVAIMAVCMVFCAIVALPKTLRYFRDRIVLAKDHLQIIQNAKETILNWTEVIELEVTPTHLVVGGKERTTGEYKSLLLPTADYAYGNELPDLIRERMAWGRAEAERAAIAASDVAEPRQDRRDWSEDTLLGEPQQVVLQRER